MLEEKKKMKRKIRNKYDSTAQFYDLRYSDIQSVKFREVLGKIWSFRRFRNFKEKLVLDVGGGSGLLASFLPRSTRVVCLDLSLGMLKVAKEKSVPCSLVLADSDHLPFRDGVFDSAFSFTILQNLPDPIVSLEEMRRVVKGGGVVVVSALEKKVSVQGLRRVCLEASFAVSDVFSVSVEDICAVCVKPLIGP